MEKLGTLFYPRFTLSRHPALAIIPKNTDYMRIIIVDEELPPPIDMHPIKCVIPDKMHEMPYDSSWFVHLQEIVALDSLVCTAAAVFLTSIRIIGANKLLS